MATGLYILIIWFLLNAVFAAAMYFRPRRKNPEDPEEWDAKQGRILPRSPPINLVKETDAKASSRGEKNQDVERNTIRPATIFVLWSFC